MSSYRIFIATLFLLFGNESKSQTVGCAGGNCINGFGTYVWETKQEYTGEWVNGVRTGLGVYDWSDGSYYYGYFVNGILEGKGVYLGNDEAKTTLVGTFVAGTLSVSENFVSTGCMLGNCYEGIGVYLWENNDMYIGNWTAGDRTGYGRFDWADGSFYTGEFKKGLLNGEGYYSSADGKVMEGTFVDNSFTGTTKTTASALPSQSKPEHKPTITGTFNTVCGTLQKVIEGFPDDFFAIQGAKDAERSILLTVWNSSVKYEAKDSPELTSGLVSSDVPFTWSQNILLFDDFKTGKARYDNLVAEFKNCECSCCIFISSEKTEKKYENSYTTTFSVSKVNTGFSTDYNDLEVSIELVEDSYSKKWEIRLQVLNLGNY
jgi:hypothetical protein